MFEKVGHFLIKSGFPSALYFRGLCDPPKNFLRVLSMEKSGVPWDPYPEVILLHKQINDQIVFMYSVEVISQNISKIYFFLFELIF